MGIPSRLSFSSWYVGYACIESKEQLASLRVLYIINLVDDGLSIVQYTNDKALFLEDNLEEARNMKLVLGAFEKLLGTKINFHKSEMFCFNAAN